jgi:hypothetical protein
VEVNLQTRHITEQDAMSTEDYGMAVMERIDEVHESQLKALEEIEKNKRRVIRAYNKKVKKKPFQVGELVWKTILPLGT